MAMHWYRKEKSWPIGERAGFFVAYDLWQWLVGINVDYGEIRLHFLCLTIMIVWDETI